MDHWSRLPEELAGKILCILQWQYAVRAQAVCRRWRYLVDSYLPEMLVAGDVLYPLRIRCHHWSYWRAWDSAAARWREMPPFHCIPHPLNDCPGPLWLTSHRGLVFLSMGRDDCFVCNPLTRKFRELPRLPRVDRKRLGLGNWNLHVDSSGKSYTIRAVVRTQEAARSSSRPRRFPMLLTYQSGAEAWSLMQTHGKMAPFRPRGELVVVNGVLHVLSYAQKAREGRLMALDMGTGVWKMVCQRVPLGVLFQSGNCVLLLVLEEVSRTFLIHSLDEAAAEMVLESTCDPALCLFVRDHSSLWECEAYGGFMFVSSCLEPEGVVYDTSTRVWQRWSGGPDTWPKDEYSMHCNSGRCYEFGMRTEP